MKRFKNFEQYSDDELIWIVHSEKKLWQEEAIQYAEALLVQRGMSLEQIAARANELQVDHEKLIQKEMELRKSESYNPFELIYLSLLWPRNLLWGWGLNRQGYELKSKQRLIAFGVGVLIYIGLYFQLTNYAEESHQEHVEEIRQLMIADSLAQAQIDWSGNYVYLDSTQNSSTLSTWELRVEKEGKIHKATLLIKNPTESIEIEGEGYVESDRFEFYPDTTYTLPGGQALKYDDRLFTMIREQHGLFTQWGVMQPFHQSRKNDLDLFKLINSYKQNTLEE
ncbi:hypothetical protein KFE98_20430 [bacterium SCSIO 12741]|nr:hypothetical protein KFE98_20430 [bacterium SCSIO 12741]